MNNKLNDSLGNWDKAADQVKSRIYHETIHKQQKKPKKPFIEPLLTAATLLLFIVGAILLTTTNLATREPLVSTEPKEFRMFDERTVEITKYEMFYRNWTFYSKEAVEFHALYDTIEKYALFYHLEQHDYKWDEERRNTFRERVKMALDYDMNDGGLKAYYEKMFADLQITEEEYIDYYLLVNKEYEMLKQDQFNKRIGLDETGGYLSGEALKEYQQLAGITEEYLNELAERIPERLKPMDPQPDLPFNTDEFEFLVTTNEQGEYVFVDRSRFNSYTPTYFGFLKEIEQKIVREELSRYSFKRYQDALRTYESKDPQKMKLAKEMEAILEILERSVEMENNIRIGIVLRIAGKE